MTDIYKEGKVAWVEPTGNDKKPNGGVLYVGPVAVRHGTQARLQKLADRINAALEGVLLPPPHDFVSRYGSEFCDICDHSIMGHD